VLTARWLAVAPPRRPGLASGLRKRHVERAEKLRRDLGQAARTQRWPHSIRIGLLAPPTLQDESSPRRDRGRRRRDFLTLARVGRILDSISIGPVRLHRRGLLCAVRHRPRPRLPDRLVCVATGDGHFRDQRLELDPACAPRSARCSWWRTTAPGRSRCRPELPTYGRVAGTAAVRDQRDGSRVGMKRRAGGAGGRPRRDRSRVRPETCVLDVVVTPEGVSADAKSGLAGCPLSSRWAAWDDAERAWAG